MRGVLAAWADLGNRWNWVVEWVFGGDLPDPSLTLFQVVMRTILIYIVGLAVVRIGKGRIIGRVTSLDILPGFILGSLLSRGITGRASLSGTFAASAAIAVSHWLFTWIACRWHWFGITFKGHTLLLVENGEILSQNMRHSHISEHDLFEELRLHGIDDVKDVRRAYKERNGQISVLKN